MNSITVQGTHLERDGRPFFWLADTIWTAFTNPTDKEWIEYLERRASQGFNVLQINALPQWDRSGAPFMRYPFKTNDGGMTFDFTKPIPDFWNHAKWQLTEAVNRGFVPAIVVQWCNYVPNTWASQFVSDNIIPDNLVKPIVIKILETFNEFNPIYIISGDTDFDSPEPIERYTYITDLIDAYAPQELKCYHIKGRYDGLPESLAERADLYLYQSGHNVSAQEGAHSLALSFTCRPQKKPIINSEPCYEQIGYSHMLYGRFRRADCRRALWLSITGGASAGITYGAHGIWNWQNPNTPQPMALGEGFLEALPHNLALQFPGADDFGFARQLIEQHGLYELVSNQASLATHTKDPYAAQTCDGKQELIYVPTNVSFELQGDYSHACITCIDLANHSSSRIAGTFDIEKGTTILPQQYFLEDAVYLIL